MNFIGWSSAWSDDEYPDALNIMPLELVLEDFEMTYYSPDSLLADHADGLERALWSAVRTLSMSRRGPKIARDNY